MKVLVSTTLTQGQRKSDFCFADVDELLRFTNECDADKNNIDGRCGCRRSLTGMTTAKGTTTFVVKEVKMTQDEFIERYRQSLKDAGEELNAVLEAFIIENAKELVRIAHLLPTGAIVEKRGNKFNTR